MALKSMWDPTDIAMRFELILRRSKDIGYPGRDWYRTQRRWLKRVAKNHGVPFDAVCGAVAVMSPQVSWASQRKFLPVFLTATMTGGGPRGIHPGFLGNVVKAQAIIREPNALRRSRIPSGPKVRAFAAALAGHESRVVIDSHMVDAGLGITPSHRAAVGSLTERRYDMLAAALVKARNVSDPSLSIHEAQAIVWEFQRASRGLQ